jgi:small conductance mechanosensitive channel
MRFGWIFENFDTFRTELTNWVGRNYDDIIKVLLIIIFCAFVSSIAKKFLTKLLKLTIREDLYQTARDRDKRLKTLAGLGAGLVRFFVWVTGFIVVINILGINTAPFLASAGVLGLALGFGAQKLINDLVSGVFIISENQYRIGDYVELEGVSGTVEDITIRTTVLRDLSGAVHHVPNGSINVATNMSMGYGQINLDITVADDTDLDRLQSIIDHTGKKIAALPELEHDVIEAPHYVRVGDINGYGVSVKIMGKTLGGRQLEVKSSFLSELKKVLRENQITLAYIPNTSTNSSNSRTKTKRK